MTDIRIKRCRIRIVRHGGWRWGASRADLTTHVARMLPEIIATTLAEVLPADEDIVIRSPVKITLTLTCQQLLDVIGHTESSHPVNVAGQTGNSQSLKEQLDHAIRLSVLPLCDSRSSDVSREERPNVTTPLMRDREHSKPPHPSNAKTIPPMLKLLLQWQRNGELGLYLRGFSEATLEAWHSFLLTCQIADRLPLAGISEFGVKPSPADTTEIELIVQQVARLVDVQSGNRATILLMRIVAAIEVAARLGIESGHPHVLLLLSRYLPFPLNEHAGDQTKAGDKLTEVVHQHVRVFFSVSRTQSDLESYLHSLGEPELWEIDRLLRADSLPARSDDPRPETARTTSISQKAIRLLTMKLVDETLVKSKSPQAILRCRIVVTIQISRQLQIATNHPNLLLALDEFARADLHALSGQEISQIPADFRPMPRMRHLALETRQGSSATRRVGTDNSQREDTAHRSPVLHSIGRGDLHGISALPFLLLGPLSQMGFLEVLDAALGSAGIPHLAPAFAAALAYKISDPPQRGWLRTAESRNSAAAFAGVLDPVPDTALAKLAKRASDFVSAIDVVVARGVVTSSGERPLFLLDRFESSTGPRFLLAEVEGAIPACCTPSLIEVLELLGTCDSACILVGRTAATSEVLSDLNQRGSRFIVDVPPTRNESWRIIHGTGGERWWTNDATSTRGRLLSFARQMRSATDSIASICDELMMKRSAIPRCVDPLLEDSLMLAASIALGHIAWTLWHPSEMTDPLLALERFADLQVRIRFDEETVRVLLPLGKRSAHLAQHRLLDDVTGVPWLGNRVVMFGRG